MASGLSFRIGVLRQFRFVGDAPASRFPGMVRNLGARHGWVCPSERADLFVLTPEEVARLIDAATGPKYRAALSVAYGAGLRAFEVIMLKVADIDRARMVIKIEDLT